MCGEKGYIGKGIERVMSPYTIMMILVVLFTPVVCWLFSISQKEHRVPLSQFAKEFHEKRYYLHAMGYLVIIRWKAITDLLNEPIKSEVGHWTDLIYAIEGEFTKHIQDFFLNDTLTAILNFHYLFIYLFLIYVTTVYFAYTGDRDMTDKVTLNYLLIYALAVPYYLFFNVEVTSSWIPGMEALLYHDGAYTVFYATHDPLDNAVPSLHVAIPFGILMLNYLHVKENGGKMKDWRHYNYFLFVLFNTILFMFSILYLGIHWFTDIPLGLLIGGVGALFIHHLQPRLRNDHGSFFKGFDKFKIRKHAIVEGAIALVMFTLILMAVNVQVENSEDRVSFRLGPEDSTYEIIQELKYGERVDSTIKNLDSSLVLEIVYISVEDSAKTMENGSIDWQYLVSEGDHYVLQPGEEIDVVTDSYLIYNLIVMHNPSNVSGDVLEVSIVNDYNDNKMWRAIILSIPSLWMTAFVLYRLQRLKVNKRSILDSSPSHLWMEEE